jgi:hypothetical protein
MDDASYFQVIRGSKAGFRTSICSAPSKSAIRAPLAGQNNNRALNFY